MCVWRGGEGKDNSTTYTGKTVVCVWRGGGRTIQLLIQVKEWCVSRGGRGGGRGRQVTYVYITVGFILASVRPEPLCTIIVSYQKIITH